MAKWALSVAILFAAMPARAMTSEELSVYIPTGVLVEGMVFAAAYGSSGAASSGSDRIDVPRLVGAAEIGGAISLFVYEYTHGGKPHWISQSVLVALGAYNLFGRGSVEWRIATNEVGLNAAMAGLFFDLQRDAPQPQRGFAFTGNGFSFSTRW